MQYYIIREHRLYLKLFKKSLLANIITIHWLNILFLIKQKKLLVENTIKQALEKMLRSMSKTILFIYDLKQLDKRFIVMCSSYYY